jgi:hypothetical protein
MHALKLNTPGSGYNIKWFKFMKFMHEDLKPRIKLVDCIAVLELNQTFMKRRRGNSELAVT